MKKKNQINHSDEELKKLNMRIEELENGWKRTQADFVNFQKRTEKEKMGLIKYANKELILELLPILDNFSRALNSTKIQKSDELNTYSEGIKQIKEQLERVLQNNGLKEIPVNTGDEFNPEIHEAVMTEESDKFETDKIIEIMENGYKLGDELIRPVKVKVAK